MSKFYSQVKNPSWANAEHTAINCEVNFNHLNDEFVPFTAEPTDFMEYSKTIFDESLTGMYGVVAEYVAPPAPVVPAPSTKEELMAQIQALMAKVESLS